MLAFASVRFEFHFMPLVLQPLNPDLCCCAVRP